MSYDWDRTFLNIAKEFSKHSTCCRKKVGAIITCNKRVISSGYNGTPSAIKHCEEVFKDISEEDKLDLNSEFCKQHAIFSKAYELHAEQNCIAFAAKNGIKIDNDCVLYTTLSPCSDCAKLIAQSGIKRVVYEEKYDRDTKGIELLKSLNINCEQIEKEE